MDDKEFIEYAKKEIEAHRQSMRGLDIALVFFISTLVAMFVFLAFNHFLN
jgi:hypothetical protein